MLPTGATVPHVSPLHGFQVSGKEDTTHTNTRCSNTLLIKRRDIARSASTMSVPIASGSNSQLMQRDGLHMSLYTASEGLHSLPTDMAVGTTWYCMTPRLKQSKDIHTKSGIGEDISKQTDISNRGCDGSLFLCKKMF